MVPSGDGIREVAYPVIGIGVAVAIAVYLAVKEVAMVVLYVLIGFVVLVVTSVAAASAAILALGHVRMREDRREAHGRADPYACAQPLPPNVIRFPSERYRRAAGRTSHRTR